MNAMLKEMLNCVPIIPYEEDMISRLITINKKYADRANRQIIEDCVSAFVCGTRNDALTSFFTEQYIGLYGEKLVLPQVVFYILSEYVVYFLIMDSESPCTNSDKMMYSLIVRNMMLIRKDSYNKLLAPEFIPPMYSVADQYRKEKCQMEEDSDSKITPEIFESKNFVDMNFNLSEDHFQEIKRLSQKAEIWDYKELINNIKLKYKDKSPFILAYFSAKLLAVTPRWKYVDSNPEKTLMNILGSNLKKKKLENIKAEVMECDEYKSIDSKSKSSVLLAYMNSTENFAEIGNLNFSKLEFAIYIYYELFLEEQIKD